MKAACVKVQSTDGVYRGFFASQCRDSSKLSVPDNGAHWWGVRNDCQGFFSVHWGVENALEAAAEYPASAGVYVVPALVFVDSDCLRNAGARIRARDIGASVPF